MHLLVNLRSRSIYQQERDKYEVTETDEEIAKLSKPKFRKVIKQKIKSHAIKYLKKMSEPHSKSAGIQNNSLKKQPYFQDRRFSKDDVQLLFTLRTKMLECKSNFSALFDQQLHCRLCNLEGSVENEDHLLECSVLNIDAENIQFADVFGNADKQFKAVKMFKTVVRKWRIYIDM